MYDKLSVLQKKYVIQINVNHSELMLILNILVTACWN